MAKEQRRTRNHSTLLPESAAHRKLDTIVPLIAGGGTDRALDLLLAERYADAINRLQDALVEDSSAVRDILTNAHWSLGNFDTAATHLELLRNVRLERASELYVVCTALAYAGEDASISNAETNGGVRERLRPLPLSEGPQTGGARSVR